jgi:dienelactone hydrolase
VKHRRRFGALVVIVAAVLATPVTVSGAAAPPKSGKSPRAATRAATVDYAVGRRDLIFVDRSRPTDQNGSFAGAPERMLPVVVLYPATGTAGGLSQPMAKPARRAGPFPLVVFSHGFTASGPAYSEVLLRRIAGHGYVVAAPTFPLSNISAPGGPRLVDYVNQPDDVSFVITKMLSTNRGRGMMAGLIDPKRVGAMGHSLGAITTLGVTYNRCCLDPRIKAAVPISGIQLPFGSSTWAFPPVPMLLIHGDQDSTVPVGGSNRAYAAAKPPKFLLTLLNGPHTPFGAPYLEIIVSSTNDFFDRYLLGDKRALARLQRDGNVPMASTLEADPS